MTHQNPIVFLFHFKYGIPSFMGMRIGDKYDEDKIAYLKHVSETGNVAFNDYDYGHIVAKYSPVIEVEGYYIRSIKCFVDIPETERDSLYSSLASGLDHQMYYKNIYNDEDKPLFYISNDLYRISYKEDKTESGKELLCLSLEAVIPYENDYENDMPIYRMINKAVDEKTENLEFEEPFVDADYDDLRSAEYEKHKEIIKSQMFELTKEHYERGDMMDGLLNCCPESVVAVFGDDPYDANVALYDFYDCEEYEDDVTGETKSYDGWLEFFCSDDDAILDLYDRCAELYNSDEQNNAKLNEIRKLLS